MTIKKLKECVSRFGCPLTVVTDYGTQFCSEAFTKFSQQHENDHVKTPPSSSQIGGEDVEDALQISLQIYRCTSNPSLPDNRSSAEVLLGRRTRIVFDLMKPPIPEPTQINEKQQYAEIHIRNKRYWAKCIVIEQKGSVIYSTVCFFKTKNVKV
ncbi:uncharacterized protein LOC115265151 [Aedes albopictus]|uniref:Integrase catalytic domain-containing protein n=1 Tax=Aedes albopictus TaxID=7160 RepID=A0ABM1ZLY7_AEDAL|nr:uncharacterized protein LOC115265151 [Aedes albopictus]